MRKSADTVHRRLIEWFNAACAQLRENRIQIANPKVDHHLLLCREVVGVGGKRRENRHPALRDPGRCFHIRRCRIHAQHVTIPSRQCGRIARPDENTTNALDFLHEKILLFFTEDNMKRGVASQKRVDFDLFSAARLRYTVG